jgi:hypothetical protein
VGGAVQPVDAADLDRLGALALDLRAHATEAVREVDRRLRQLGLG